MSIRLSVPRGDSAARTEGGSWTTALTILGTGDRSGVSLAASIAIGTAVVTSLSAPQASVSASSLTVTATFDGADAQPGNGVCDIGSGQCTLRAAIQEANALPGTDTIQVPTGTYSLTAIGAAEDLGATGDLDVTGPVSIVGHGAATT